MRAGPLRHRVEIQEATEAQDAHGQMIESWARLGDPRWAQIRPMSGREIYDAETPRADVTHEITMRHHSAALTPKHRIRRIRDGRVFTIVSAVNYDERNRRTVVMAREAV